MIDIEGATYHTKGDLLRGIGKKANDNKLVDRMIGRGEVYVEDGVYHYIGSIDVRDLIKEIKNLREGIKVDLGAQVERTNKAENTLTPDMKKQIDDLNSDLDYQIKENEKLKIEIADYQNAIRNCYYYTYKLKKVARPDFRDSVLKLTKEIPGEDNQ